jgi:hypothetical protein
VALLVVFSLAKNKPMRYVALALFGLLCKSTTAQWVSCEDSAIRVAVTHYIEGRNNGDSLRLQKAFHPDAVLKSVGAKGELVVWSAQDYIKRMSAGGKQDCTSEIVDIKSFHNAAQATVVITYPTVTFYDFLNLVKLPQGWVITDKVFARRQAAKDHPLFQKANHK